MNLYLQIVYLNLFCITKSFIRLLKAWKYLFELLHILCLNNLINTKSNLFKRASNAFFLASLVYLRLQQILPYKKTSRTKIYQKKQSKFFLVLLIPYNSIFISGENKNS